MEVQLSEETSCDCPSEDQKKVELNNEVEVGRSNLIPHEFATDDATPSEAILVASIIQGDDTPQSDCSCTEETKVETETSILLDREVNNSSGWQKPIENGDCSEGIPRIESDKLCENASVESSKNNNGATSLETVSISNDRLNMADNQRGSICIEMECITERNDAENVICDKISPQNSETTIIYVSEGDNSEIETDVCRICHCSDELEVLISPCSCTGSVKFVHHSCLMNWLQRAVMSKCELCLFPLAVKRKRKPFYKWRLPEDKPFPILWLFTFVVAMTLNIASIAKDGSQRCVSDPCIIFYVLGSAGALLGLAFFYHWLRKTVRYFAKWIALNQEWSLVGTYDVRTRLGQTNLGCSLKSLSEADPTQEQIA